MKANERRKFILERLQDTGSVSIAELSESMDVSTVTVRADLSDLEASHLLHRVRGGAVAAIASRYEGAKGVTTPLNQAEKERIVDAACRLIRDGYTIFISSGSTAELLAARMPDHVTNLVVATNSINVARILANHPGVEVIVTGGTLRPGVNSLVAPLGDVLLKEINADLSIISSTGVSIERGFTNSSWAEAEVAKAMVSGSRRRVFLADHAKLNHVASARIIGFSGADILITDNKAPQHFLSSARDKGVEVQTV
jgi:DeoR family transcriptional regulator of aga operon